ncbi:MAG: hypothetical protein ACD_42C00447G0001 [uncultured bacterium]|nr:MAG: hypothetical protein ACD_42C00447G0001 [uncultured bacterium]OGT26228.1 MAG: hypothetical protein A3B71_06885 [Gammaproteobacteria bacterium RIFCSPHIGHO2_02_FULL_42_43]OGT29230.1 MAG: hypothetical protein A2624_05355 [Gammaproteobacteria bacterium RIFCSPHIGHO2_01_FULL_42_8]OGT52605.1 MAG: hypothetical protein A3E54_06485 [Gammaproteobacteria bacterium RIFCSPHIGHO2_12_FULL_41_25]OGT63203.1 MAG: hypothetical protein A3I77_06290 [Gammaproteobacteria bacterium RIFCSPLOWO2_02_FULL_42_14]OGT
MWHLVKGTAKYVSSFFAAPATSVNEGCATSSDQLHICYADYMLTASNSHVRFSIHKKKRENENSEEKTTQVEPEETTLQQYFTGKRYEFCGIKTVTLHHFDFLTHPELLDEVLQFIDQDFVLDQAELTLQQLEKLIAKPYDLSRSNYRIVDIEPVKALPFENYCEMYFKYQQENGLQASLHCVPVSFEGAMDVRIYADDFLVCCHPVSLKGVNMRCEQYTAMVNKERFGRSIDYSTVLIEGELVDDSSIPVAEYPSMSLR